MNFCVSFWHERVRVFFIGEKKNETEITISSKQGWSALAPFENKEMLHDWQYGNSSPNIQTNTVNFHRHIQVFYLKF